MIGIGIAAVPSQENVMSADSLDIEVPPMYRHSEDGEMGGYHGIGHVVHESIDAVSELLGLSPEEIREERESGKSLVEIAEEQGVSEDALIEAIMAAPKEAIEQKVEDGILTQEQADHLLERLEQIVQHEVNREEPGFPAVRRIREIIKHRRFLSLVRGLKIEATEAVSELLSLSPEEIREERESGKSLVEIAEEQGVSEDALIEAIMAAPKEVIEQKVEDGNLTQERADQIIERLEQRVIWRINRTEVEPTGYSGCNGSERHAEGAAFGMAGQWSMAHDCDETEGQCFGRGNSISRPNAGNQYAMQWA
jgi:predicted DNA-binding protein YlxM (UPF0122 family)